MSVALHRKLNARNIILEEGNDSQTIGVRRRDGSYGYLPYGGFVDRPIARALPGAVPVKLNVERIGVGREWALKWQSLKRGEHVLGCAFDGRAYAVLENGRPIIVE